MLDTIKYLQSQGIGSRKQCRFLLEQDRIRINGQLPDSHIDPQTVQTLTLDEHDLCVIPQPHYLILLHKPAGFETSHKPRDYPSVFSLLPDQLRATEPQAIGRLDADTTGVLLITNDGALNHRLTAPKYHVAKHYRATLKHPADAALCQTLQQGVLLHDDKETVAADHAELANPNTLDMVISQGKYHQVKRMIAAAGNRVVALHRVQFGTWRIDDLPAGQWRFVPLPDENH